MLKKLMCAIVICASLFFAKQPILADSVYQGSSGISLPPACDKSAIVSVSPSSTVTVVNLVSGKSIYVCSYTLGTENVGGTATTFQWAYGTGTNCGTGTAALMGALYVQQAFAAGSGLGPIIIVPAGNALCLAAGAGAAVGGMITYAQF